MGNVTLAVVVFSYAGQLNFTAVAGHDTWPDVEVFAQGVRDALDDLQRRRSTCQSRRPPTVIEEATTQPIGVVANLLADVSLAVRNA
jgi:hypothetical protein